MPLVDVTHASSVPDGELVTSATHLPDPVAAAIDCPREPWDGPARTGDIEIQFRPRSEHHVGELRITIETGTTHSCGGFTW